MRLLNRSWLCLTLAFASHCLPAFAQEAELLRLNSPHYEAEATKLRSAPTRPYEFSKAMLGDVIRFMATDAGMSFFSLPDGSPEADRLITFTLNASPFQALETLCKANGLALVPDGGIWYVRSADDKELIGKAYQVKHNSMERVSKISSGGGSAISMPGGSSGGSGSSGGEGGGMGGVQSGGVDLQGARETFRTDKSELINDIRAILDLAPDNGDGGAGASLVSLASGSSDNPQALAASGIPLDMYGNVRRPKVLWKSDSNTLYVVATRLQHMWVEGYLAAADKPQAQIAIEVKFFETSRDPSREFGLDWTGTFGQSGFFRQVDSVTPTGDGGYDVSTNNVAQTEGGYRADLSNLLSLGDLNQAAKTFGAPATAVLSAQDVNVKLRALLRDEETRTVSYPRMVTTNNREVVIRSVVNQPVLGGSASASLGAGSTTTSSISYLPIGTVINILPKKMMDDKINLNLAITVSSIIGTEVIQGNPYPIASSRVYSAPVELNNGYTVAVGGLDEAREREGETGIPVLGKIPIIGYAFKTKSKAKNHKNLMIFITPSLIDVRDGGLPEVPQAVVPRKPDALMPKTPRLSENGGLVGGIESIPNAIAFMYRSSDEIKQTILEARGTKADYAKIDELETAVKALGAEVDRYLSAHPERWEELNRYKWQVGGLLDDVKRHRKALFKKGYY
ncbi:MAG: type II secretion system protein GspD [Verrucomicrobium sp.]